MILTPEEHMAYIQNLKTTAQQYLDLADKELEKLSEKENEYE